MEQKNFGIVGHPIKHSLSKTMFLALFKELKLPHTYDSFDIKPEELGQFIQNTKLDGINITIPHKHSATKYVDKLDASANSSEAINTVKFTDIKKGYNTDGIGFLRSIDEENISLKNKTALVIGAGGASRSILISLRKRGANIILTNRTKETAIILNEELKLNCTIINYNNDSLKEALQITDIIINTTSIGMEPNTDKSPLPKELLSPNHVVFDIIYNPLKTRLIREAEGIGCKTISGLNMLAHQGAESLKIWLNINPPINFMKNTIKKALQNTSKSE